MKHPMAVRMIAAVAITAGMVAVSELLAEREVIFPEIMALATGALVAPKRSWRVSAPRMVALIGVCSTAGLAISCLLPLAAWLKVVVAFALCQAVLPFTGTTFAPIISAVVLPVMLGTTSWIYPVSSTVLTALIAGVRVLLERSGCCGREPFEPVPRPDASLMPAVALRIVVGGTILAAAVALGVPFCAAPPLLVAFTELTRASCPARQHLERTVLLVALAAAIGAGARLVVTLTFGLPLTLAAVIASALVLVLMRALGRFFPPAGAMAILPMLIPAEQLAAFPVEVLAGIVALALGATWCLRASEAASAPELSVQD